MSARGVATLAALLVTLVTLTWAGVPGPAVASCAEVDRRSPHAFRGVVTAVRSSGRVATVRTDAGVTVEVRGGPPGTTATSVDRTFSPGGRYEFHPVNASSPFEDNACTATRLLAQGPVPAAAPTDRRPAVAVGLAGAVVVVAAGAAVLLRRRSRRAR